MVEVCGGLGIIGAVAIIRFRTNIQNPRNIIFMFESISIGIATGVYGYAIAIAGTAIFCLIAVVLYFSAFGEKKVKYQLILLYREEISEIEKFIVPFAESIHFKQQRRNAEGLFRREYILTLKANDSQFDLFRTLNESGAFEDIRIEESNNQVVL